MGLTWYYITFASIIYLISSCQEMIVIDNTHRYIDAYIHCHTMDLIIQYHAYHISNQFIQVI